MRYKKTNDIRLAVLGGWERSCRTNTVPAYLFAESHTVFAFSSVFFWGLLRLREILFFFLREKPKQQQQQQQQTADLVLSPYFLFFLVPGKTKSNMKPM